ncbi:MAG: mannitol dehydrogenase family protein [Peptoniphilaceae bacterium]|nr:mannitol dehydrogenase family protein [Peptoniphilaceae bacterium]MDY6019166.1 mannitol dehydrogenase family protein [Anaerococcus sp.]
MKLNLQNLKEINEKVDQKITYDVKKLREASIKDPKWIAFGSGNIFKGYIARIGQDLINKGLLDRGISVVESFDEEILADTYKPYDNLALSVTLHKNGDFSTNLIGNLSECLAVSKDKERIEEIFLNKNLELASFTITEKGYNLYKPNGELMDVVKSDLASNIEDGKHLMTYLTYLLYKRFKETGQALTLLSLDNCSKNGDKIKNSVFLIAKAWYESGKVEKEFIDYLENKVSYPWTMIDKITPRPAEEVKDYLEKIGFEDMDIVVTGKNTYTAPYVNSEEAEYLVVEDDFVNGRPPFEKVGLYMTDRETVNKVETMKVTTCLNPLHTTLATFGCVLGYKSIAAEMQDELLVKLIKKIGYDEALKVVVDPGILNPKDFIDEVINVRFPNKYIPDTPQRIATDTSQKVAIRFGETIKAYRDSKDLDVKDLNFIPLSLAGWLRYLLGVDDRGEDFELSKDPLMDELKKSLSGIELGKFEVTDDLEKFLENDQIFGLNLVEVGLDKKILKYLEEMSQGPGSVRATLEKYLGE